MKKIGKKFFIVVLTVLLSASTVAAVCASEVFRLNQSKIQGEEVSFSQVVNGLGHTLALSEDGLTVYGWGLNDQKQVKNVEASLIKQPVVSFEAPAGLTILKIAATERSSAALLSDMSVYTWGTGDNYQNGTDTLRAMPARLLVNGEDKIFKTLSAGLKHYAALATNDKVITWGDNSCGQVRGDTAAASAPPGTYFNNESTLLGNDKKVMAAMAGYNNTLMYVLGVREGDKREYYVAGQNRNKAYVDAEGNIPGIVELTDVLKDKIAYNDETLELNGAFGADRLYGIGTDGNLYEVGAGTNGGENVAAKGAVKLLDAVDAVYTSGMEATGDSAYATVVMRTDPVTKTVSAEVFGTAVWATGSGEAVAPADAVKLTFQTGEQPAYVTGGYSAFQFLDEAGRLHILGNAKAAGVQGKFPAIADAVQGGEGETGGKPLLYNLSTYKQLPDNGYTETGSEAYYQNNRFYVLVPASTDFKVKDGRGQASFDISVADLLMQDPGTFGFSEKDVISLAGSDTTLATRYGSVQVKAPYVVEEAGVPADAVGVAVNPDSDTKLHVQGKAGSSKPTTGEIRVRFDLLESVTGGSAEDAVVNVIHAEVVLVYGNWIPKQNGSADRSFEADANARNADSGQTPIEFTEGAEAHSYKQKTFCASDLVVDPDDSAADNTLTFIKDSLSVPPSLQDCVEFIWGEEAGNRSATLTILARKACDVKTIDVFVGDRDSVVAETEAAKISLTVDVVANASPVVNGMQNGMLSVTAQKGGSAVIQLDGLYEDSRGLAFMSEVECNSYVRAVVNNAKSAITVTSNRQGSVLSGTEVKIVCHVVTEGSTEGGAQLVIKIAFPANAAPERSEKFNNTVLLGLGTTYYTPYDLFTDPDTAKDENGNWTGDALTFSVVQDATLGYFETECNNAGTQLAVTPKANGTDRIYLRVQDTAGHSSVWQFTFEVKSLYTSPQIVIGPEGRTLTASYLAGFIYNMGLTEDQKNASLFVGEAEVTGGGITAVVDGAKSKLTVTPQGQGEGEIVVRIKVSEQQTVSVKVRTLVLSQTGNGTSIVVDNKTLGDSQQLRLSLQDLVTALNLVNNSGNQLAYSLYEFKAVYLTGREQYATAAISESDASVLLIKPLKNTPVDAPVDTAGSQPQYIEVLIGAKSGTESYSVLIPVVVQNLKLYPTAAEYNWIFIISCVAAGAVILVLILISFGIAGRRKRDYSMAMERAKARDRMKKAAALGADKEQILKRGLGQNVKITPSVQRQPGMMPPPMGPNSYMRQGQSAPLGLAGSPQSTQQGWSQPRPSQNRSSQFQNPGNMGQPSMNRPPQQSQPRDAQTAWQMQEEDYSLPPQMQEGRKSQNKSKKNGKRNSSTLALDSSEPAQNEDSLPPLKANTHVPKNARDEIESKIQARIAQENALRQQEQQQQEVPDKKKKKKDEDDDAPKMSRQERKKQEMLEKLRAKMMADRNK